MMTDAISAPPASSIVPGSTLVLQFEQLPIHVVIRTLSSRPSRHTGKALLRLTAHAMNIPDHQHERLIELINADDRGPIAATDRGGKPLGSWNVRISRYSKHGGHGKATYDYVLDLDQVERYVVKRLYLNEMALEPYEYDEKFSGDLLNLEMKVKLGPEDSVKLRKALAAEDFFTVVREGLNDQPRTMRVGAVWWSEHDQTFKYHLSLWDYKQEGQPETLFFTDLQAAKFRLAGVLVQLDALVNLLVSHGILSTDEVQDLKSKARSEMRLKELDFHQVRDADLVR